MLSAGDTLELSVVGTQEIRHRASIGLDGKIALPFIGRVVAAGKTISVLHSDVQQMFSNRSFVQKAPDGRETLLAIDPVSVTLDVAEYRPVYINGDVSSPGEKPFKVGLTIRQLIAVAGGYDVMRLRMSNPFLEQADLRAEYEQLWRDLIKYEFQKTRVKAELAGSTSLPSTTSDAPISNELKQEIARLEGAKLRLNLDDYNKQRKHIEQLIEESNRLASVLSKQYDDESEGVKADLASFERVNELHGRGTVPVTRLTDERRLLLISSTRALQTKAQLSQVNREQKENVRALEKLDEQRTLALTNEIQEVQLSAATVRSRLQAVSEKLFYTSMIKSQVTRGNREQPRVKIFRKIEGGVKEIDATEDTEVLPGDMVEVALRLDPLRFSN
jgi:polysaccharide export outer membrane protein